jgi:hypothetical protein
MEPNFSLRFDAADIPKWEKKYSYGPEGIAGEPRVEHAKSRGYFTKEEFLKLCQWKTPRSKSLVASNSEAIIQEVTHVALSTTEEGLQIKVLLCLDGVSWPTASTVLHFAHRDPYPILDFRALWSLGLDKPPAFYTFKFWSKYVQCCRQLALGHLVTMRELDRALWQYSRENQKDRGSAISGTTF